MNYEKAKNVLCPVASDVEDEDKTTKHQAFVEWNADACNTLRMNYDRDIIFQGDAIPDLDATFDGDIITNDHIVLDETMGTYITILPYLSMREDHTELPDVGTLRHVRVHTVG